MSNQWRDETPTNLIKLAVGRCLIANMDHGKWMELGLLTNTQPQIEGHHRLLRSLRFGDDDYDGCVFDIVPVILGENPFTLSAEDLMHLNTVSEFLDLPAWLAENDPTMFARLFATPQDATLPDGTVLSAAEAAAQRLEVGEMRRQIERIRRDHATDPEALIGQAKELVESTCKTVLGLTGTGEETKVDVPKLVKRTLIHLGLDPASVTTQGQDATEAQALRRILGGVSSVLNGADELRNVRGTGHGRSGSPLIDGALARLTVGLVLPAVVYLCEVYEKRTCEELSVRQPPETVRAGTSELTHRGDIVRHATFGEGQVLEVTQTSGGSSGPIASIDFGGEIGIKRLLVRHAGLVVVHSLRDLP